MKEEKKKDYSNEWHKGYDAGYNKPDETNSHHELFATPEQTKVWLDGNTQGKKDKERDKVATS